MVVSPTVGVLLDHTWNRTGRAVAGALELCRSSRRVLPDRATDVLAKYDRLGSPRDGRSAYADRNGHGRRSIPELRP